MRQKAWAYYNEIDPFAANLLRELMKEGCIAPGDVDERSIEDVVSTDLAAYTQCHFFAGIGGWSLALRMAGWPDDRPVWTGSAPCQSFSSAGKRAGFDDERHLWPAFLWHIQQCRPGTIFGEQVASADALRWWDVVATDLEDEDYACTAVDLCAASVGAFHVRQRLFWVANSSQNGRRKGWELKARVDALKGRIPSIGSKSRVNPDACGDDGGMGYPYGQRLEERFGSIPVEAGFVNTANPWTDIEFVECIDRKARPTKPGIFPLAHGIPNRVGTLRGAGNAIVPQAAAELIKAYLAIS